MRPLLVLLLLLLIGAAAWLLWEKLGHLRPPKAPETQSPTLSYQEEVEGEMTTIVDTSPKLSSPPTSSLQKLSDYATLELAQAASPGCQYIRHTYYALCYDEMHEQPRWTVYVLKAEQLRRGRLRRSQDFRPDPNVKTISAQLEDYRKSGYDRGHLVPAADFKWDSVGMSETFYLSNMSPQLHAFNAGIWERVESTVRAWALQKKQLVIYTGPILDTVRQRIGKNRVSVPRAYYKVVYHLDEKEPSAVAFLVPHAPSERLPTAFLVTVDSVEKVTGIDFFPALPDQIEERIEGRLDKQRWRERAAPR